MQDIKLLFQDNEEILKIISLEGEISDYLGLPSGKCSLIGSSIELGEFLGEGKSGEVFDIKIEGMGTHKYVVKKSPIFFEILHIPVKNVAAILKNENFTWKDIKSIQSPKTIENIEKQNLSKEISLVIPPKLCRINKHKKFAPIPNDGKDYVHIPEGSYLCPDGSFSEFAIGAYLGKLYRDKICINFFDVYAMFACPDDRTYFQYIFMDKIDSNLKSILDCVGHKSFNYSVMDGILIQTLFAIAMYQHQYSISHNDLHTDNVFIEYVKKDSIFSHQNLYDADYYHYNFTHGGIPKDIYFPAVPVIVKIGDFGFSEKYSKPIIANASIIEGEYGDIIPNIYYPSYDSLYFLCSLLYFAPNEWSKLCEDCLKFMCKDVRRGSSGGSSFPKKLSTEYLIDKKIIHSNSRPTYQNLLKIKSSLDVLNGPIFEKYKKKPNNSAKIVTLGGFDRL
jgi:hypothetical protein